MYEPSEIRFTSIDLFREQWVVSSYVEIGVKGGAHLSVPPVRIIDRNDSNSLAITLREVLNEDVKVISEADFEKRVAQPSAKAVALGLSSDRAIEKEGRLFMLIRMLDRLRIEEWTRAKGGGYVANPIKWSAEFTSDDFDRIAEALVETAILYS